MAIQKISGVTIELTSQASGDVAYFDGTDWVRLAKGDAEQVLTMNEIATAPQWGNVSIFQGTQYGYSAGGFGHGHYCNHINKFSMTTDGDATDIGALTVGRDDVAGTSSSTHGYTAGGGLNSAGPPGNKSDVIDKHSFATDAAATDVGNLVVERSYFGGASSATYGYVSSNAAPQTGVGVITKWSYAADGNGIDVGDLTVLRYLGANASSETYGYAVGGDEPNSPGGMKNIIDRWSFATDGNAVDVGDLHTIQQAAACNSSSTHAYEAAATIIQKFSFASGTTNATSLGQLLTVARFGMSASSSITYGFWTSGWTGAFSDVIDKMSYASEGNATNVGDLTHTKNTSCGHQY